MESESSSPGSGPALGRWWGQTPQPSPSTDVMNQLCRVCGEPAAGFHFGAFTCEGCKSFFGRTYNNLGSITECKNNGECVINKKNRTTCKACRLRKCLLVGMSKSGSRYGRRSNWFKIHCLLQEQQQAGAGAHMKEKSAFALWGESYKTLATSPHFDLDSKGSPTEESITLNNNNLSKDREKSPNTILPSYSAEAAAALWAARHSLFPMQLPHHPVPSIQMPFMPPFAGFSPPGHPQAQRNVLLPFIQNLHSSPSPQSNHQPLTVSSSPSRSSQGSVSSQSPPPSKNHLRNSPPTLEHSSESTERHSPLENRLDKIRVLANNQEKTVHETDGRIKPNHKISEEHSLAMLRGLGPVQEQPMDLSVKFVEVKNRRKSKLCQRVKSDGACNESESSEGEISEENDSEGISDSVENNNENFSKRKTPLDLTKSSRLEV